MADPAVYIRERFPQAVYASGEAKGINYVTIAAEEIVPVLQALKEEQALSFTMLTDLFGVDYGSGPGRFEINYLLHSFRLNRRFLVKIRLNEGEEPFSVAHIWQGANWLEREIYDLFGLRFRNHPDLRRILLPDEFIGHPLRKDFPVEGDGSPFVVRLEEEGP